MHYSLHDLDWVKLGDTGWQRATVTLKPGDTASNPASTKEERRIHGPALVTYDQHRTGITVYVE